MFDGASKRTPRSVRELHSFNGQFTSIKHLRQVLCAELSDDLPHLMWATLKGGIIQRSGSPLIKI